MPTADPVNYLNVGGSLGGFYMRADFHVCAKVNFYR